MIKNKLWGPDLLILATWAAWPLAHIAKINAATKLM
jgi:hypothetical protein